MAIAEIGLFYLLYLTTYVQNIGETWFLFSGVLVGTYVGLYSPFLYFGDENGTINMFLSNDMYLLYIFIPCPEPPMGISGEGIFPVQSGGPLTNFLVPFECRKVSFKWANPFTYMC